MMILDFSGTGYAYYTDNLGYLTVYLVSNLELSCYVELLERVLADNCGEPTP